MGMDDLDRRILDALQQDFPLHARPFDVLAARLGIDAELLWRRVETLLDRGVIRRLGASFDSRRLGFRSTLAAVRVGPELVDRVAQTIGRYPEVTHSYLRDHELGSGSPTQSLALGVPSQPQKDAAGVPFNLWFTIIAVDDQRIEAILREIRTELSLDASDVLSLPMKRGFKLDARFKAQP